MTQQKQKLGQKLGFSLLELSIVTVIVGILVIAVSSGSRALYKARLSSAQSLTKSSPVLSTSNLLVWYETTMENSFKESDVYSTQITTWYNLNPSMNTNNATNSTASPAADAAPIYTKSAINGIPALNFFGSNLAGTVNKHYLTFDGTGMANTDYTVIVVEQRSNQGVSLIARYFLSGNGTSTANQLPRFGYSLNNQIMFSQFSNDYTYAVANYITPVPRIHVFRFTSALSPYKDYYQNGQLMTPTATGASPSQGLVSYVNAQIGRYTTANYYSGYIGEIIIFTKYINDDERKSIEQYLSKKWRISIS